MYVLKSNLYLNYLVFHEATNGLNDKPFFSWSNFKINNKDVVKTQQIFG